MSALTNIEFSVEGRPPRKDGAKSLWSSDEAQFVLKLREEALKARTNAGFDDCFHCPVHLELNIFAPNITNIKESHIYVGDLDAFIAGVCESMQPAHPYAPISMIFQGKEKINPSVPLIIENDSQVVSVMAKKVRSEQSYYTVSIRPEL